MASDPRYVLMAAQALPEISGEADVPEWIHLVPSGRIETIDGRGPFHIVDPQAVINASFAPRGDIEIDVNHSTFLAAPQGKEAPARGWITAMEAREDGIWGKVRWTEEGRRLVASGAYRRISPVFGLTPGGGNQVASIRNASLVNRQNLRGLTALNQEQGPDMDFMAKLAEALGLSAESGEDAIFDAIKALKGEGSGGEGGEGDMHAELAEIGKALGCADGADVTVVLNAARELAKGGTSKEVVELQAELSSMATELNQLKDDGKRGKAEAFVDGAIRDKRVGVKAGRERFISLHMSDPAGTEELVKGFPQLGETPTSILPPAPKEGEVALNAEQLAVANMLGQDPEDYAATLADEQKERL